MKPINDEAVDGAVRSIQEQAIPRDTRSIDLNERRGVAAATLAEAVDETLLAVIAGKGQVRKIVCTPPPGILKLMRLSWPALTASMAARSVPPLNIVEGTVDDEG